MNKYQKWYNSITNKAKTRVLGIYTEQHHIVPKSLGGSDDTTNLVNLTAREHFLCHWLLIKIYPDGEEHWKMLNALRIMQAENANQQRYDTKITGRVYANLKEEYAQLQSARMTGEGNPMFGRIWTEEEKIDHSKKIKGRIQPFGEKERQRTAQVGRTRDPFTNEWKDNLSKNHKSKKPGFDGTLSDETKKKLSEKAKLRTYSAETNEKRRQANLGSKREKKLCPHCQQSVSVNGFARWHGDNCRAKV